jgi:ATP-binding cassette subfamily B protein
MTQKQQNPLSRLWQYTSNYHGTILVASSFSVLNKVFDLAPPILIGMAVDVVVEQQDSILADLGISSVMNQLIVLAVLTAVIWAGESLFQYLYALKWRNLAQAIQHDVRLDAYDHTQRLDMAFFEERSSGGLMAVLNDDVNQLERFLDIGANEIIQLITTIIVIGGIFIAIAPEIAWMTILPMPIIVWGSIRFQKRLEPRYARMREQVGILNSQLSNNLGGMATIKSFTAEEHELGRVRVESNEYKNRNREAISLSAAFVPLIRMVIMAGFIAILVSGGRLVLSGSLEVGAYSVLIFMTQRLLWPLTRLGETVDLYQRAMASTARIMELLDTESHINSGDEQLPTADVAGEIVLEDVSFAYGPVGNGNGRSPVKYPVIINDLSMRIQAGQTAAIVGATGAGKTTLMKLLLRFYDVSSGHLRLDGHDLRDLQLSDLRQSIGFVSQDVFLFHGTVRENIAYGTFDAPMEKLIEASKLAEAHDFIMALPQGYDTIVGERGQKLSGGQRQRISIARAILKDPPVLVLDEATSSVDNETEAAIQRSLERIAVGRTTIVIAHRLSTVRNADVIFVLENGQLKENGRHEELVSLESGIYAGLWQVQTGRASQILGNTSVNN